MSWYFFGGFSAYAIDPSARVVNHSGCSFTQGWSGDACSARSIATSRPKLAARDTNAAKSANVPRSGWMASCPPSAEPIAQGEPGSPGLASRVLLRPLRKVVHVEPHAGDRVQPARRGAQRSGLRLSATHRVELRALRTREELIPGSEQGTLPLHKDRQPRGPGNQVAERVPVEDARDLGLLAGRQPVPWRQAAIAQLPGEPVQRGAGGGRPGGACRLLD